MSRHVLELSFACSSHGPPMQNVAHGPTLALFHTLQIWQYAGRWSSFEPAGRHVLMKIK